MGCWTDFDSLVSKYRSDYDDGDLMAATLQAAVELGEDIGGFSDRYTTTFDGTYQPYAGFEAARATVPLPIMTGWELTSVHRVRVNGVDIEQTPSSRCMSYSVDCRDIIVLRPLQGREVTISIDYGVSLVAGKVSDSMPDFLFEAYNTLMVWKILYLLCTMKGDHKSAAIYDRNYREAKNKRKARAAGGSARIDARSALWI